MGCQKLGIILENKVLQKLNLSKNVELKLQRSSKTRKIQRILKLKIDFEFQMYVGTFSKI